MKKKSVNGSNGNSGTKLTEAEQAKVREIDTQMVRLKLALADVDMQIAGLEEQRHAVRKAIAEKQSGFVAEVQAMARAHNIDIDKGNVHFDYQSMTLTSSSQEAQG